MLAIDLGIFYRAAHTISLKEAAIWSLIWMLLAFVFNGMLYLLQGPEIAFLDRLFHCGRN